MRSDHASLADRRMGLRRQWFTALAVRIGLLVTMLAVVFVSSTSVVNRFDTTALSLQEEAVFTAQLQTDQLALELHAHGVIAGILNDREKFIAEVNAIEATFVNGFKGMSAAERSLLNQAHQKWSESLRSVGLYPPSRYDFASTRTFDLAQQSVFGAASTAARTALGNVDVEARSVLDYGLGRAHHVHRLTLWIIACVFMIALIAALLFGRNMARQILHPVSALAEGVRRVRDGHYDQPVQLNRMAWSNELSDLAVGINEMTAALASTHQSLSYQAQHDSLTGLPNRAELSERLAASFAVSGERRRCETCVLFIDLDDFKSVNDTLGHAAGDELLVAVAQRLQECIRPTDVIGRLGGDEFAVLVAGDATAASSLADRILASLSKPLALASGTVTVTASIGIGIQTPESESPDELLGQADFAMYLAKGHGKHRFEIFDAVLHATNLEHMLLKSDLRAAVGRHELVVNFQPVFSLIDGSIRGAEALVRWQHPTRGLLGPDSFIPLAEQSGDIDGIGIWVLQAAMQHLALWRDAGVERDHLWVSVNVSPLQLTSDSCIATMVMLLDGGPVPASHIVLEVTETALVAGSEHALANLQLLKGTGARIALDDFGTGMSSLSALAELPIDIIKIDRHFVSGDNGQTPSPAVLGTIIELAKRLDLDVVAEGIEHHDQADLLNALGCTYGQGFALARPSGGAAFEQLLDNATTTGSPQPLLPFPRPPHVEERAKADPPRS